MEFIREDSEMWILRARQFLASAKENLKRHRYEVACFESEQAAQLALKARIFQLEKIIPRTRSIRDLLRRLALLSGNHGINIFLEQHLAVIRLLEEAHDKSRYSPSNMSQEEAQQCVNIARDIVKLCVVASKHER